MVLSAASALPLLLGAGLVAAQSAAPPELVGTWASKSNKTLTGPVRRGGGRTSSGTCSPRQGFYDPIHDRLIEPSHTGIAYSFSDDGHYEAAYYRAIANRMFSRGTRRERCRQSH